MEKNYEEYSYGNSLIRVEKRDDLRKLYVELSSECNFSCEMCFRNSFEGPQGIMDEETLDLLKREIRRSRGLKEVVIGGLGEPFLHPGLIAFVEFLKNAGLSVTLQTNGHYLNEENTGRLLDARLDRIVFSYEPGDIGHGEQGALFRNLDLMVKEGKFKRGLSRPMVAVESVLTKQVLQELPSLTEECIHRGVNEFVLSNLVPIDERYLKDLLYFTDDTTLLDKFHALARHKVHYQLPNFSLVTERSCQFVKDGATVVRFDGEVVPCYRFLHSRGEIVEGKWMEIDAHSFGSIMTSPLFDIWNTRDYLWFRFEVNNSLYPSCPDCQYRGGCDYLRDAASNCYGGTPSCGYCLWGRNIIICP